MGHCRRISFDPEKDINYIVTGTDQYGCNRTVRVSVTIKNADAYIPNAFTPNGDGINDRFHIITRSANTRVYLLLKSIEVKFNWP